MRTKQFSLAVISMVLPVWALAGIFGAAPGSQSSTAVPANDASIVDWAAGYQNYAPGTEVDLTFQTPQKALGAPGNSNGNNEGSVFDIVSLGRGGSIVLSFDPPIVDGAGYDFAVFENSFSNTFLELAKVEVSSDGVNFVQFLAFSLVPAPVGVFGNSDPSDIEQLAGKYRAGYGTPFDLSQLSGNPLVDLNNITYVRLIDVVGDGLAANSISLQAVADWAGITSAQLPAYVVDAINAAPAAVYDPYPTISSAGFDLDAIGVINQLLLVQMDVVPADPNNTIDPDSSAVIPVAVLSSSVAAGDAQNFDATQINPASLRFGYTDAANVSTPLAADADADGLTDMSFGFRTQDTGIACEDISVVLLGETLGGEAFSATDFISTGECDDGACH